MGADSTITHLDELGDEALGVAPQLFVALDCERPLLASARLSLADVDEVLIERDTPRRFLRILDKGVRRLVVQLEDRWMSSSHARLFREGEGWSLEDLVSKNGTLVNGIPFHRATLASGDVLEVGHTLLLFREGPLPRDSLDLDADHLAAPAADLATFQAVLAGQFRALAQVARQPLISVMILGATGTGKELVARALHELSGRQGPFVAVNCGSIAGNLFEAELFGYRKGAFTGASEDRPGLIRAADGGTLFLDEVAELSAASQAALLRVLQEREVLPVGATKPIRVDLRVVTATHQDLSRLSTQDRFRADLYARLSTFKLDLPGLADRREDLGLLIAALLGRVSPAPEKVRFTCRAARALFRYRWPLNIRELENCLRTATALADQQPIDMVHLPESLRTAQSAAEEGSASPLSPEDHKRREQLIQLFAEHQGNVAAVARAMGKAAMQVHRWIKRYGLSLEELRRRG